MLSHNRKHQNNTHSETHSHRHQNTTTTLLKSPQTLLVGTHHYINSVKLSTTNRQTLVLKPMIYQTPSIGAFDQHNLNYLISSSLDASSTSTIAPVHLTSEKWPLLASWHHLIRCLHLSHHLTHYIISTTIGIAKRWNFKLQTPTIWLNLVDFNSMDAPVIPACPGQHLSSRSCTHYWCPSSVGTSVCLDYAWT